MNTLYVEDNLQDVELAQQMLRRLAPHVKLEIARSVAEGVERLAVAVELVRSGRACPYDIVLTDVRLPDGNGMAVLSYVRSHQLPIAAIVLTGSGDERTVVSALRGGADDYLTKDDDYLIQLPRVMEAALEATRRQTAQRARPIQVLYAEHNAHDAERTLRQITSDAPHLSLTIVDTAEQLIAHLPQSGTRTDFDVLLLDYPMPGIKALDLIKEVRQQRRLDVPIVVVAGLGEEASALAALKLGADDYVVKREDYLERLAVAIENTWLRVQTKRAERALRSERDQLEASEARFRQLTGAIREVFWLVDLADGRLLYVSPAVEAVTGRTVASLHAAQQPWTDLLHPADRERVRSSFGQLPTPVDVEHRNVRPDGTIVWVRTRAFPVCDETGTPVRIAGVSEDITERREVEEARADLEAQLQQAQKMEALGTLAGGIAHDFNNLLGAITCNLELVHADIGENGLGAASLADALTACDRAKDLTQQILAFTRNEPLTMAVVSLAPVIKEAADLVRVTLPADVQIRVTVDGDIPDVLANPTQIHQVLMNLSTNASHAFEGRSGCIEIAVDALSADAAADLALATARHVHVRVTDNGKGMDPATLAHIYEPFFTTKPHGQGTGLGLAVVHRVVSQHRGSIRVQSAPGRGTTFHLYFPEAPPEATQQTLPRMHRAKHPSVGHTASSAQARHVAIVDDETSLVFLMTQMLKRCGYKVSGFTRAVAALEVLRADSSAFDVIVTDYNMPDMSGTEFAAAARRVRPDLPVVLCSGFVTEELLDEAHAAGVCELLRKPSAFAELRRAVDEAIAPAH